MAKRQITVEQPETATKLATTHNRQQFLHTTINTPSNILLLCVISKATHEGRSGRGRGSSCRGPNRKAKSANIYPQGVVEATEKTRHSGPFSHSADVMQ